MSVRLNRREKLAAALFWLAVSLVAYVFWTRNAGLTSDPVEPALLSRAAPEFEFDAAFLPDAVYLSALLYEIGRANKRFIGAVYTMQPQAINSGGEFQKVVNHLARKASQGLWASVVLDQMNVADKETWKLNDASIRVLRRAGIDAGFDERSVLHHVKAFVADNRYLVLGSHNWSRSSLAFNKETSVFLDAPALAGEVARYLETIPILSDTDGRPWDEKNVRTHWEKREVLIELTNKKTGNALQSAEVALMPQGGGENNLVKRTSYGRNAGKALFENVKTDRTWKVMVEGRFVSDFELESDTKARLILPLAVTR